MARGHGRILTSVWEDSDFLTLTQEQQRLYLFLISQPNLNHAGLLPLTLRRWSRKAAGLTLGDLDKHLAALDDARFIVVDDDTEELLVRSFVRNDGVWKQPKVMGAMVSGAMEISSWRLRRALLSEVGRIPLDELSDEPTKLRAAEGPSIRQQVSDHIEALRRAFREPEGTPPTRAAAGASETPSATPSRAPSGTPFGSPADGPAEPSTRGRAGAQTRAAPAPAPAPAPNPSPIEEAVASVVELRPADTGEPNDKPPTRNRATGAPDSITITDVMRTWAIDKGMPAIRIEHETERFLDYHRSKGNTHKDWIAAWRNWMSRAVEYARLKPTGTYGYGGPYQAADESAYHHDQGF